MESITQPMPWYVAGPLIGLILGALLIVGNRSLGISSSFRHICAATVPKNVAFLKYDWKAQRWNLLFVLGIIFGGVVNKYITGIGALEINEETKLALLNLGFSDFRQLVPAEIYAFENFSLSNLTYMLVGGLLIGFGTSWAGGCTSGHAIMGLSDLQLPSLFAVMAFFAGGIFATHLILPLIF